MSYPCGKYEQITPSHSLKVLIILTLDTAYQTKKNNVISTLVQQQLNIKFRKKTYLILFALLSLHLFRQGWDTI